MSIYIAFVVGAEELAIPINKVREIYYSRTTVRVPHAPPYMIGVISVRGKIVPVMDLGLRIGLAQTEDPNHEVIVVEVPDQKGDWLIGLLVDSILGLKDSEDEEVCPPPQFTRNTGKFVSGIFKESGCLIVDLEKVCRIN